MTKIKIYNPVFGVPITFLSYHNPEQFDILGHEHDIAGNGGHGIESGQFEINGRGVYKRILIKRYDYKTIYTEY